ncbi:MAG TPA: TlpA disulfide reductase family protein [Planctomycetota bacterium]|nr:TlpA disulfide reductase family protein [Planctomycetota bacterium]
MRGLFPLMLLTSLCAGVCAQKPKDAAAKPSATTTTSTAATEKWQELTARQEERTKGLKRGDKEAVSQMFTERLADLEGFAKEFPKSTEANKALLEVAQIAMQDKTHADAGKDALAKFDAMQADLSSGIMAIRIAAGLKLDDRKEQLMDLVTERAKTIEERMELVTALKLSIKDEERADKVLAATEAMAKSDEDKASILIGKANLVRYQDRKNKEAYTAALAEVAKAYPATKAGKLAAGKIAAADLKAGSDPVAFKVKDMDGKDVSPADYKGKVLLIDFWATWCGPCMGELPNVLEVYQQYHDKGFEILGISLDRDTGHDKLVSTIKDRGMSWRHVYDGKFWSAEVAQIYDVQSIPFTVLIGKDGKVIGTSLRGDKLGPAVEAALEAK